jgi:hypothetical protein
LNYIDPTGHWGLSAEAQERCAAMADAFSRGDMAGELRKQANARIAEYNRQKKAEENRVAEMIGSALFGQSESLISFDLPSDEYFNLDDDNWNLDDTSLTAELGDFVQKHHQLLGLPYPARTPNWNYDWISDWIEKWDYCEHVSKAIGLFADGVSVGATVSLIATGGSSSLVLGVATVVDVGNSFVQISICPDRLSKHSVSSTFLTVSSAICKPGSMIGLLIELVDMAVTMDAFGNSFN